MPSLLAHIWPHLAGAAGVVLAVLGSAHAVLYKRDVRAAASWVGVILLVPFVGVVLYILLGVNRIKRRAVALQRQLAFPAGVHPLPLEALEHALGPEGAHLVSIAQLMNRIVRMRLVEGNRIVPLVDGEAAYPAMLEAIEHAQHSVALATYIFDHDSAGARFVDAMAQAKARGVEVRVLVDAVGARYSGLSSIPHVLTARGIPVARFLPTMLPWRMPYANLRNHRKLLVVDGQTGFTGGMNIRASHLVAERPPFPTQDVHFRVAGPVVNQLQQIFAEDWAFTTGESLSGPRWFPELATAGETIARGVADGPDEDYDKLRWAYLGALASARTCVQIVTPYFLPDNALIMSLAGAALRGVRIDIVLPAVNNMALVQWASMAQLWQLLEHGCCVWLSPPPFDHSKLLVVDNAWTFVGSGNWDPRSLRFNFEFNIECYDSVFASQVSAIVDAKMADARALTLREVDHRSLPTRLRDGLARLAMPYL